MESGSMKIPDETTNKLHWRIFFQCRDKFTESSEELSRHTEKRMSERISQSIHNNLHHEILCNLHTEIQQGVLRELSQPKPPNGVKMHD